MPGYWSEINRIQFRNDEDPHQKRRKAKPIIPPPLPEDASPMAVDAVQDQMMQVRSLAERMLHMSLLAECKLDAVDFGILAARDKGVRSKDGRCSIASRTRETGQSRGTERHLSRLSHAAIGYCAFS